MEQPKRQQYPSWNSNEVEVERSGCKRCYQQLLTTNDQCDDALVDSAGVSRPTGSGNLKSGLDEAVINRDNEAIQLNSGSKDRKNPKRPADDEPGDSSDDSDSGQSNYWPRSQRRRGDKQGKKMVVHLTTMLLVGQRKVRKNMTTITEGAIPATHLSGTVEITQEVVVIVATTGASMTTGHQARMIHSHPEIVAAGGFVITNTGLSQKSSMEKHRLRTSWSL